ncbi:MAG: hypothetical protein AAGA70_11250 [Pseudomonadota bacterium]
MRAHAGFLSVAFTAALPAAGPAEPWTCAFTALCEMDAACDASNWDVSIFAAEPEAQALFSSLRTGDILLARMGSGDIAGYAAPGLLLTIEADSATRLSLHDEAGASTYFGTCEVSP